MPPSRKRIIVESLGQVKPESSTFPAATGGTQMRRSSDRGLSETTVQFKITLKLLPPAVRPLQTFLKTSIPCGFHT